MKQAVLLPDDYHALAQGSMSEGEFEQAIAYYKKALVIDPHFLKALNNIGVLLKLRGRLNEAKAFYLQALSVKPDFAQVHNNLGNIFLIESDFAQAQRHFIEAIKIKPDYTDAYNSLGLVHDIRGELDAAYKYYSSALRLDPNNATTLSNVGNVFAKAGQNHKALQFYNKAIRIEPSLSIAYYNRGNVFREQGLFNRARLNYQKAIFYNSEFSEVYSSLYQVTRELCRFSDLPFLERKLDELAKKPMTENSRPLELPLVHLLHCDDQQKNVQVASSWARYLDVLVAADKRLFAFSAPRAEKKIRVGYLVNDTFDPRLSEFIREAQSVFNHKRFEMVVYSCAKGPKKEGVVSLFGRSPVSCADRVYDDTIDILVDLNGHSQGNRLEILAFRPAPIQVSFMGYPGLVGADFIDYTIVDRVIVPRWDEASSGEKLVVMPTCYQAFSPHSITIKHAGKRRSQIPQGVLILGSLAKSSLIDPVIFEVWVAILKELPKSVLVLASSHLMAQRTLKKEAARLGLDPSRVIFTDMSSSMRRNEILTLIDQVLDTQVSDREGTANALGMGVPVITVYGGAFHSRISASLLHAVGCSQLITHSLDQYGRLALALGRNKPALEFLRHTITTQKRTSPLFDRERFMANLESAYEHMWRRYADGKKAKELVIKDVYLLQ